jgi:hypothetical protein
VPKANSQRTLEGLKVSHEEFLKAKPMRNPDLKWEEDEKGLHIKPTPKQTRLSSLIPFRRRKGAVLDEQGAFVWKLCDGEHQIKEIASELGEKYKMRTSDATAALELYLVQLSKNRLMGFVMPESVKKRYYRKYGKTEKAKKK